jgi:dynein heavy chain
MDLKYSRVLKYCEGQIDRTLKLFKKRKGNPPVPRNFPPLSGSIRYIILVIKLKKQV